MNHMPARQAPGPRFADPALVIESHTAEDFQDDLSNAEHVLKLISDIVNDGRARDDDGVERFDCLNSKALLRALDDAHVRAVRMRDRHAP